jgi:branched-chain amino acid transport system substrate-binding protein
MKELTKALAVFSMVGGAMFGTQALAEPFKIGVCYDLSKAYTFATP